MILDKLENLGLSDKESKVYLAALELGGDSIQNVAKKSGVHRATTYLCVEKLKEMGLMNEKKKGKRKVYYGEYPEKLLENIVEQQKNLDQQEIKIKSLLPELSAIFNFSKNRPRVKFFEGEEGLKKVYQDTLFNNEKILAFLSVSAPDKKFVKWLYDYYAPERTRCGIKAWVIAPQDEGVKKYVKLDKKELRETKLVNPQKYPFSIEINIYGNNKVAFMSYGKKEMFGVIIESKEVHNTMKYIFELVWDNIK
jgi:sugar-specific transcriptional regulator TrmB